MSQEIYALTREGYNALPEIVKGQPELFLESKTEELKQELQSQLKHSATEDAKLFSNKKWTPAGSLDTIISGVVKGPSKDAEHAMQLRQLLPTLTRSDMATPFVTASINCFHLSKYVCARWQSGTYVKSDDKKKQEKFIKDHWLGKSKQANGVARIWWLYEYAKGAAQHSQYELEVLLEKMAGNVNFYHQMLSRSYLMASDRIRATIIDVAISSGLADENKTGETNKLMRSLNRTAGGISLDILPQEQLRHLVEEALPPKEDAAPSPQP